MVYEGVVERLNGVSHALRSNRDYQKWMDDSRPAWTPIFKDSPPQPNDLQVDSQGSSQGGSAPAQGESQGGSAPSQGQDPALPVADADPAVLGSLDMLRYLTRLVRAA